METLTSIQKAFTLQSRNYDILDHANPILDRWRTLVHRHVNEVIKPNSRILELNSGSGLDALRLVKEGHSVLATDIAPGMIEQIKNKIAASGCPERFRVQLCSFEELHQVKGGEKFDFIFSNMGGLNCCPDLTRVTHHIPGLLEKRAYVTWAIMPPFCPWEWLWFLKGKNGFRRLRKGGTPAHMEGEYFQTFYHSVGSIQKAFGKNFRLVKSEGLGALSPPPSAMDFVRKNPGLTHSLSRMDEAFRHYFPFNRCADHIILTFQYIG